MKKIFLVLLLFTLPLLAQPQDYPNLEFVTVSVSSGDSNIVCNMESLFGLRFGVEVKLSLIFTDTTMTSTSMTFQIYDEKSSTYKDFYESDGTQISYTIASDRAVQLAPTQWYGIRRFKIVLGTAESADRNLTLVARIY